MSNEKLNKKLKENIKPDFYSAPKVIQSYEKLQEFIKKEYPDYNNFHVEIEPMNFGSEGRFGPFLTFSTIVALSKEKELLTEENMIEVNGFEVSIKSRHCNMEMVAICIGNENKVIPVLKVKEK